MDAIKKKLTTREGWVGDYDYAALLTPRVPCIPSNDAARRGVFFGLKDTLPILVAALIGLTHALASAGGIISVPRILGGGGAGHLNLPPETQAFLISTALIVSGLMTVIQILRVKLFGGYYIGTGLISISGTSFTFLPIAEAMFRQLYADGYCKTAADGVTALPCPDAYGRWLGTIMVAALIEVALSFLRPKALRALFPPIVTGTTVSLIGASLIAVGMRYWGGGAGPCISAPVPFFEKCPNILAERAYPWGHSNWIGLGFLVLFTIVLVELFGSPFMRNIGIVIGFGTGVIVAAALGYMDDTIISRADWFTFLWVKRFKLGFFAPILIPVLLGYLVSTIESVGDITASCDVSRVETEGPVFESRVQGGLLADGLNSIISGLMGNSPTTTFSQNNGVILQTGCANTAAGLWAAAWLIFFGFVPAFLGHATYLWMLHFKMLTFFLYATCFLSTLAEFSTRLAPSLSPSQTRCSGG